MELDVATIAYVAGIIDTMAVIRVRTAVGVELPYVALSGSNEGMLRLVAATTGTKVSITRRSFMRAGCSVHCREKHQHIESTSGRWSVSGVKATVLLYNIRPYMRLQGVAAGHAVDVGLRAGFKPATVQKMINLGWSVPEFDERYRRR